MLRPFSGIHAATLQLSLGMLIRFKRIYNFWVMHASFVLVSHVFTVIYIIFMHFIGLTYWQDAKCQFPVCAVFLFQKFTSGNILGTRWKFWRIFYLPRRSTRLKESWRGGPQGSFSSFIFEISSHFITLKMSWNVKIFWKNSTKILCIKWGPAAPGAAKVDPPCG